jgi:superfamily I DNA/RNA helicase
LVIIEAKSVLKERLEQFDFICVDETQRLYGSALAIILELYNEGKIEGCIFSYDFMQCLSKREIRRNNPKKLRDIDGFKEMKLSDRIRTNKVIYSFIRTMLRLTEVPRKPMNYDCIDIVYANDITESDRLLRLYENKGYTFITFTPSQFVPNGIDHYSININSHQVIGQEFDNVVVIMDNNFRHNVDGDLEGKEHPNPDYLFARLFYQNISRTRERLCIIVLNNPKMFRQLLQIKENEMIRQTRTL